jgi:hypothetical protein
MLTQSITKYIKERIYRLLKHAVSCEQKKRKEIKKNSGQSSVVN